MIGVSSVFPASLVDHLVSDFARFHGYHGIVGESYSMNHLFEEIKRAGPSNAGILILGQTGTGKELVARAIHKLYDDRNILKPNFRGTPFVPVNSASIPEELLESTLFGYSRGAFTGADHDHPGKFQKANGGVIYFDEIGDLSLSNQAKLLRAIEEGEVTRLGSGETRNVNVRMIAATNRNLDLMLEQGKLREDFYFRLYRIPIKVPPLVQREGDIRLLAEYFVLYFSSQYEPRIITEDGYRFLESLPWRGNVRELMNFIHRSLIEAESPKMDAEYFKRIADNTIKRRAEESARVSLQFSRMDAGLESKIEHNEDNLAKVEPIRNRRRNFNGDPFAYYLVHRQDYEGVATRTEFQRRDPYMYKLLRDDGKLDKIIPTKRKKFHSKLKRLHIREILAAHGPSGGNAIAAAKLNTHYSSNTYVKYWRKAGYEVMDRSGILPSEKKRIKEAQGRFGNNASAAARELDHTRQTIRKIWNTE